MNFRTLLYQLEHLETNEFTTLEVAVFLQKPVKMVSIDLRRLHQMGFLKRKHKKRPCLTKTGKLCYKGVHYRYSLFKQGWSYVQWMRTQEPLEDATQILQTSEILKHLPKELTDQLLHDISLKNLNTYKGPRRRFRLVGKEIWFSTLLYNNAVLTNENRQIAILCFSLILVYQILREEITRKRELIELLTNHLKEVNNRYDTQLNELVKSYTEMISESLQQRDVTNRQMFGLFEVLHDLLHSLRRQVQFLISLLYRSLPEETFQTAMDSLYTLERQHWERIRKKMNDLSSLTPSGSLS